MPSILVVVVVVAGTGAIDGIVATPMLPSFALVA
jgi:hypothetical protein